MEETTREVVAVFKGVEALEEAVYNLETRGFDRAAFSLLASEESVMQKLGHRYQRVSETEDDPQMPRDTFFSRISRLEAEYLPAPALAAVGVLIVAGTGAILPVVIAAGGGGALIGAALGRMMHERHATRVREQLERGGLLLWVSVRNVSEEETALRVLRAHSAHDVHSHEIVV
jgi:hypothetical protein